MHAYIHTCMQTNTHAVTIQAYIHTHKCSQVISDHAIPYSTDIHTYRDRHAYTHTGIHPYIRAYIQTYIHT